MTAMGEITKDELQVMIQVITRNTEQLSILAERFAQQVKQMEDLQDQQEKTNARLYNGMAKEISNAIIEVIKERNTACAEKHSGIASAIDELPVKFKDCIDNSSVSKSVSNMNFIAGAVALVVVLAVVIIKVLDSRSEESAIKHVKQAVVEVVK